MKHNVSAEVKTLIIPIVAADALCEEPADPRHKRVICTPQKNLFNEVVVLTICFNQTPKKKKKPC